MMRVYMGKCESVDDDGGDSAHEWGEERERERGEEEERSCEESVQRKQEPHFGCGCSCVPARG
eukprot:8565914-Pyramimonas_sp.AAC.1